MLRMADLTGKVDHEAPQLVLVCRVLLQLGLQGALLGQQVLRSSLRRPELLAKV